MSITGNSKVDWGLSGHQTCSTAIGARRENVRESGRVGYSWEIFLFILPPNIEMEYLPGVIGLWG